MPPPSIFGCAIGVMSGTSGDGVDALMLELASSTQPHRPQVLAHSSVAFDAALQAELCCPEALSTRRLAELHYLLPTYYAAAIKALPGHEGARVCGVHGQTLWHQTGPDASVRCTLQIGSAAVVAQLTGLPVVSDMRAADVVAGGLGAPVVPLPHWFFWGADAGLGTVVNFGGMCNLTRVGGRLAEVVGYDVGPGMCLSDAFARHASDGKLVCDMDGTLSRGGHAIPALVDALLAHPFVQRPPPKSCGREEFSGALAQQLWQRHGPPHATVADVAMSLLVAPLAILRQSLQRDPCLAEAGAHLLLTGGGARNPQLQRAAQRLLSSARIEVHADGVFAPNNHEPAAMALIAARTLDGLPSSLPQVTGAQRPSVLGSLTQPPAVRRDGFGDKSD